MSSTAIATPAPAYAFDQCSPKPAPLLSARADAANRTPSCAPTPCGRNRRDYFVRTPARLLKDPRISPGAKLLRVLIAAFADERTGRTYVSPRRLDTLMCCGRNRRQRLQNELLAAGWLRMERERMANGHLGKRIYFVCVPPLHRFTTVVE